MFGKPQDMVIWLMDNPGEILLDGYGRKWMYKNWSFYFCDIGQTEMTDGLKCLHLHKTVTPF